MNAAMKVSPAKRMAAIHAANNCSLGSMLSQALQTLLQLACTIQLLNATVEVRAYSQAYRGCCHVHPVERWCGGRPQCLW